jgi:hypothetical protein
MKKQVVAPRSHGRRVVAPKVASAPRMPARRSPGAAGRSGSHSQQQRSDVITIIQKPNRNSSPPPDRVSWLHDDRRSDPGAYRALFGRQR